jgi:hypothetical protein
VSVSPSVNYCDVDGDGALGTNDALALAAAIGSTPPIAHDLTGDGFTNILDLQSLVNAITAGACWR